MTALCLIRTSFSSAGASDSAADEALFVSVFLKMALTLMSTFLAAVSVASCYPAAFEDLGLGGSKYCNDFLDLFYSPGCWLLRCLFFVSLKENRTSIKFLALGDWGGVPYPPYITAVQKATAGEMSVVAERMGADFVLALGDNFYYTGVNSVDSSRFKVGLKYLTTFSLKY